jgi:hypothetical protein
LCTPNTFVSLAETLQQYMKNRSCHTNLDTNHFGCNLNLKQQIP